MRRPWNQDIIPIHKLIFYSATPAALPCSLLAVDQGFSISACLTFSTRWFMLPLLPGTLSPDTHRAPLHLQNFAQRWPSQGSLPWKAYLKWNHQPQALLNLVSCFVLSHMIDHFLYYIIIHLFCLPVFSLWNMNSLVDSIVMVDCIYSVGRWSQHLEENLVLFKCLFNKWMLISSFLSCEKGPYLVKDQKFCLSSPYFM